MLKFMGNILDSTTQLIVENEKIETVQLINNYDSNLYDYQLNTNNIRKTTQDTIWYPALLTSFLVGKRTKRCR